jgi:acid phosphatase
LVESPAVAPSSSNPTNNVNVISYSYIPNGMNIHFQTPFGLGEEPRVHWGTDESLGQTTTGHTDTSV